MAVKELVPLTIVNSNNYIANWVPGTSSDTGQALDTRDYTDITVQAFGNFGGGNIQLETSNNKNNWCIVRDNLGIPVIIDSTNFSTARLLAEHLRFLRWVASGGVTSVTVSANLTRSSNPEKGI